MRVLVVGATGLLGQALVRELLASADRHAVIALVRQRAWLPPEQCRACAEVEEGDAESASVVRSALNHRPDVVVIAVGESTLFGAQHVREKVTKAFVNAMNEMGCSAKLVVVSSVGAGNSLLHVPWPNRLYVQAARRRAIRDHEAQEKIVSASLPSHQWLVVRPTLLKDRPGQRSYVIGTEGTLSSSSISREDVAQFIVEHVEGTAAPMYGKFVSITS